MTKLHDIVTRGPDTGSLKDQGRLGCFWRMTAGRTGGVIDRAQAVTATNGECDMKTNVLCSATIAGVLALGLPVAAPDDDGHKGEGASTTWQAGSTSSSSTRRLPWP